MQKLVIMDKSFFIITTMAVMDEKVEAIQHIVEV